MPTMRWHLSPWSGALLVATIGALWQGFWVGLGLWMLLYGAGMGVAYAYWSHTQQAQRRDQAAGVDHEEG